MTALAATESERIDLVRLTKRAQPTAHSRFAHASCWRAPTISDDEVEAVIVKTLETTPKGETHWSTRTMAATVGMSHTMIGRI